MQLEREFAWRAEAGGVRDPSLAGEFVVSRERRADALILSLSGELDLATSALLERELDAAQATRPMRLVIDLTGLEFIDSSEPGRPAALPQARTARRDAPV